MRIRRVAALAALALVVGACGGDAEPVGDKPLGDPVESATVDSTDKLTFEPKRLALKVGGTVTWTNTGNVPHTVTFPGYDKPLTSGDELTFTFTSPGTTQVRCTLHPAMTGEIVVV